MLKKIGLILTFSLLCVVLLQSRSPAQISVNLQADVTNLKSQVSQLRSEIAQLRAQRGISAPSIPAPQRPRSPELNDDQIVDRLAILAIEAKDRLNALENRVAQLEKKNRG